MSGRVREQLLSIHLIEVDRPILGALCVDLLLHISGERGFEDCSNIPNSRA